MKEFQKSLSHLVCAFLQPILETSSVVCWGVKASMMTDSCGNRRHWYNNVGIEEMSELWEFVSKYAE